MKKKIALSVLSIAALLVSLGPSCAFAQQPRDDPLPFNPLPVPDDWLRGDRLPRQLLPNDPFRLDPFRIDPLDRKNPSDPFGVEEFPWKTRREVKPELPKTKEATPVQTQVVNSQPSPKKLPRWLVITGVSTLAVLLCLLGLSICFRRKILRFFLRLTLSKTAVKTTAAKILEIRSGKNFESICVKHSQIGSGRYTGFGWSSPVFFVTAGGREALKCPPRDGFQILQLLRARGTEQDSRRNRRYVLTFEQVRRCAERA